MRIFKKIKNKVFFYGDMLCMLFARVIASFIKGKGVWMCAEKETEARDNGYCFYRYLRETYPDIKAYYVISHDSPDLNKVLACGESGIVSPGTLKHRVLLWTVQYNACSQPICDYFPSYRALRKLKKDYQINIHLRHGIAKDNLSHGLDADKSAINLFITASTRERRAIMSRHSYDENSCVLTGFCRYDKLPINRQEKSHIILIMPTFRHWLMTTNKNRIPSLKEREKFINDSFCIKYKSFLYSSILQDILNKYNYKVIFYPHYCAQPFINCFIENKPQNNVIIATNKDFDVQELLIKSDILITDYSSVFFDFAYMKKPEIFYQFDEDVYREAHYEEGYFKYRDDAFGPIVKEEHEILDYLEFLLKNNSEMESLYEERVDSFFAYRDNHNCKRVFDAIVNCKN